MNAQMLTADAVTADALMLGESSPVDRELLKTWLVRLLTVLMIVTGVVLTFYILGALGFVVYGLPRNSFRSHDALQRAA